MEYETSKQSSKCRLEWFEDTKERKMGDKIKESEREQNRLIERINANFKVYIEVAAAVPEDLSRIALALPPWPINVKLSGSREAIRLWKRKTH